jgi:hypothetical protein
MADAVDSAELFELVVYQTVDSDDKSISIHRCSSWVAGFDVSNFTGWNADGDIIQSRTLGMFCHIAWQANWPATAP